MVDALSEVHRILIPGGLLIDARPDSRVVAFAERANAGGLKRFGVVRTSRAEMANDARLQREPALRSLAAAGASGQQTTIAKVNFDTARATEPGTYRDPARLCKFCGNTRMIPPRGLSMSAMRKSAIERAIGKIRKSKALLPCAP